MSAHHSQPREQTAHARTRVAAGPSSRRAGHRLVPFAAIGLGASLILAATSASAAEGPVDLGLADSFAILAGAGITNTGPTTVTGDIGTFPTPSQTGFGSITLTGANLVDNAVTVGAKLDLVTAYDDAFGRTPATSVPVELGGSTLLAGVYTSPSLGLTGTLTLDAQGIPDAVFIFQAGTTLITEANSRVLLVNGASPCNVVWQVGSSATFKTDTVMVGDVLAHMSITAQTRATFQGRLLASVGAVTLDTNTISKGTCAPRPAADTTTTTTPTTSGTTPTTTGTTPTTTGATPTTTPDGAPALTALNSGPESPSEVTLSSVPTPVALVDVPETLTPEQTASGTPGVPLRSNPGTPKTPPTRPSLPATGIPALPLLSTGLLLLASGAAATAAGRRSRRRSI